VKSICSADDPMELIVVTSPDYFEGEGRLINEFFAEGLGLLHLRKPGNDALKFRQLMMEIDPEYYPAISIHQHHELADEFSLRRLHFTAQHRKLMVSGDLNDLSEQGFYLSSSVHGLIELTDLSKINRTTEKNLSSFDYFFYGPVFNSISKKGYHSQLDDDFILPPHLIKVIAIGGVQSDRLVKLKRMNFDGAAVLGTIWHQKEHPVTAFKKIIKAILELK